jgi:hypothetical protein
MATLPFPNVASTQYAATFLEAAAPYDHENQPIASPPGIITAMAARCCARICIAGAVRKLDGSAQLKISCCHGFDRCIVFAAPSR